MQFEKADFSRWESIPDKAVWDDWVATRKEKRAKTTQTAINRASKWVNLLNKYGYSATLTLEIACERGWQGLEWVWNDQQRRGFPEIQRAPQNIRQLPPKSTREVDVYEQLNDRSWAE